MKLYEVITTIITMEFLNELKEKGVDSLLQCYDFLYSHTLCEISQSAANINNNIFPKALTLRDNTPHIYTC